MPDPSPPVPSQSQAPTSGASDKKARRRAAQCIGPLCRRSAALRCTLGMCLSHCREAGGCAFHGFQAFSSLPSSGDNMQPVDVGFDELQEAIRIELASFGVPYPDGTQVCSSSQDLSTQSSSLPLSQLPPPTQASMTAPESCLQPPLVPGPSIPDVDIATPAPTQKGRPRITHQLDHLWLTDLNERARREVDEQKVVERRREMEKAAKQCFILCWYDAVCTSSIFLIRFPRSTIYRTMRPCRSNMLRIALSFPSIAFPMTPFFFRALEMK